MKLQKIFLAAIFCLLLAACKKENGTGNGDTLSKMVTMINVQDGAALKYKETFLATGDSLRSLIAMAAWCLEQPDVEKVFTVDDYMIELHFKNGLISPITVIPVDANGIHLARGGGKGNIAKLHAPMEDDFVITNDKAVIFIPFIDEFYYGNYNLLHKFTDGKQKLQATLLVEEAADLAAINTFKDYGLIIINTHGSWDGFEILTKIAYFDENAEPGGTPLTAEQLQTMMAQANNLPLDKLENDQLRLAMRIEVKENGSGSIITCDRSVLVTQKYIRNIPALDKAIVFGNHCGSGYNFDDPNSDPLNLPEAWKLAGAITYYGYSFDDGRTRSVGNDFARQMEDSLITNLLYELDSTGIAHLANDINGQFEPGKTKMTGGIKVPLPPIEGSEVESYTIEYTEDYPKILAEFYFQQFDDKRYKYKPCGDTITDARDGKKYPTVCIGEQVWMAANLNWAGAGTCYLGNASFCTTYGRLYTWSEMMNGAPATTANPSGVRGICPEGWHIPSNAEWEELITFLGGSANAGGKLKSTTLWAAPNTGATNETGFTALPAGHYDSGDGSYESLTYFSLMWSASAGVNASNYGAIELKESNTAAFLDETPGIDRNSCRCVKD